MYENLSNPFELNGKPLRPDRSLAEEHVRLLTDDANTNVCFCASDSAGNTTKFYGTVVHKWPEIERLQDEGCEIYLVVNESGNTDAGVTDVPLFVNADGVLPPDAWHVDPDFFVRRDETHWQAYWRVADMAVDEFTDAQRRLAAHYGTDQEVYKPSQVVRLAGTLDLRDPARPHLVAIVDNSPADSPVNSFLPRRHEKHEVLADLPPVPVEPQQARQDDVVKQLKQDFAVYWPGADMTPAEFWDDDGMLPRSPDGAVAILYGDWGSHKTNVVLTMLFDTVIAKSARAVYAAGEGFRNVCGLRVPVHCKARGINAAELEYRLALVDGVPLLTNPKEVEAFIDRIRPINPEIVVIDTLATASAGLDENSSQMSSLLTANGPVGKIRREFNALIVLIAHEGKTAGKGVRGHSGLMGNVDAALKVTRKDEMVDITVEKMRDGPDGHHAYFKIELVDGVPVPRRATWIPRPITSKSLYDLIYRQLDEHGCHGEDAGVPSAMLAQWINPDNPPEVEAKLKNKQRQSRPGRSIGPCESLRTYSEDGWRWFIPEAMS